MFFCTSSRSVISEQSLGLWWPHPPDSEAEPNAGEPCMEERGQGAEREEARQECSEWREAERKNKRF